MAATRRNPIVLSLNDRFPFGRYKNRTVKQVLDTNPEYISWFGRTIEKYAFALEVGPAFKAAMHYCSPAMMARVYRGAGDYPETDDSDESDESDDTDDAWGGLTDDDMRNDA